MKILVTGGAGFIGSHTVVELIKNGFEPVIVDDFRNSEKFILDRIYQITKKKITHYPIDCKDYKLLEQVFKKEKPDGIIHFAADKAVNESIKNPLKYYSNNIGSLLTILELTKKYAVGCFVFSSSCTVYGDPDVVPINEGTPFKKAINPYGYSKQIGEQCLQDFNTVNPDTSIIILRYFNPIGAHPSSLIGELPIGVPNSLVPYITQTAAGIRKKITVFGNDYNTSDGSCIRDYIHVVDLANAHILALNHGLKEKLLDVFNVGTGKGNSVIEVIKSFEKANQLSVNYEFGPRREGDAPCVYADNKYITKTLNWKSKYSLDDALEHAWNWQKTL